MHDSVIVLKERRKIMKHVSINTNDSRDSKLEELGIKTISVIDAGMYSNRHVVYTYDNKLWLGSGYESFSPGSTNQYHYDTQSNCLLLGDTAGYTDEELSQVNPRMVSDLTSAARELLSGRWLFPETLQNLKNNRTTHYQNYCKESYKN